jgi:hypothetical protein
VVTVVALEYSVEVSSARALIGESITAVFRCVARTDAAAALTFEHRSLVVELDQDQLPEPLLAFPNRRAVEDGGRLIRLASTGGIEDLAAGEERVRVFDLLSLFPEPVLSVGTLAITFRLEEADPPVRPPPVSVEVTSGPEAVPLLIDHLGAEAPAIRHRAAGLLAQMTARDFGYDAEASVEARGEAVGRWRAWWKQEGSQLPWNFQSEGATFGQTPDQPPATGRSGRLGGIAYPGSA